MSLSTVNRSILTPVEFLTRSVFVYPEKIAVVHGNKRFTYREFAERIYRLANALKARGVGKGDKVAFICPNIPPMLEAHYGVPMIGAALVSVNIRLAPGEVSYIIDHSDAKIVVVDSEF
ncbi:MAG: AMP-binding protein, partial [Desulforhopalus sp.]